MPYLSIVIPAYNEASRLPATLNSIQKFIEKQPYSCEVIIVDDGSKDGTSNFLLDRARTFPAMRPIINRRNQGKGQVVKQGMLAASGDYRLFMDADGSTPVTDLPKLLEQVANYEVVIGSRYVPGSTIRVKQPFKRRFISRCGNLLTQMLLLPGIRDTQCGFKLFSAEATEKVFKAQRVGGWWFDLELLVIARHFGFGIKEVAIEWTDAKQSSFRATQAGLDFFMKLWEIRRNVQDGVYTVPTKN